MLENKYTKSEIVELIDERIVGRNAQRNRLVLYRRFIDGITYERLAEEFDMSDRQIKRIVYKAENQLFKKLR